MTTTRLRTTVTRIFTMVTAAVWRLVGLPPTRRRDRTVSSLSGLSGPPALQGFLAAVEVIMRRVVLILQLEELESHEFCKHNSETDTCQRIEWAWWLFWSRCACHRRRFQHMSEWRAAL